MYYIYIILAHTCFSGPSAAETASPPPQPLIYNKTRKHGGWRVAATPVLFVLLCTSTTLTAAYALRRASVNAHHRAVKTAIVAAAAAATPYPSDALRACSAAAVAVGRHNVTAVEPATVGRERQAGRGERMHRAFSFFVAADAPLGFPVNWPPPFRRWCPRARHRRPYHICFACVPSFARSFVRPSVFQPPPPPPRRRRRAAERTRTPPPG